MFLFVQCNLFFFLVTEDLFIVLRKPSSIIMDPSAVIKNQQMDSKRMKTGKEKILIDKTKEGMGKMIELEYISSDEGF